MSHAYTAKRTFRHLEDLREAFATLGATLVENGKLKKTYSSDPKRNKQFDYVARFSDDTYDVGVTLADGHIELTGDFTFSRSRLLDKLGKEQGLLQQAYNAAGLKRFAIRKGYKVQTKKVGNELKVSLIKS